MGNLWQLNISTEDLEKMIKVKGKKGEKNLTTLEYFQCGTWNYTTFIHTKTKGPPSGKYCLKHLNKWSKLYFA